MPEFITLTCPKCGGRLQITEDIERFSCGHCGTEHIVKRGGGIVVLKPVLENVSRAVDNTASELAIARIDRELYEAKKEMNKFANQETQILKLKGFGVLGIILVGFGIYLLIDALDTNSALCMSIPIIMIIIGGISSIPIFISPTGLRNREHSLQEKIKNLKEEKDQHYRKIKSNER